MNMKRFRSIVVGLCLGCLAPLLALAQPPVITSHVLNFCPKTRKIIDDTEAVVLMTRHYRRGWEPRV